MVAQVVEAGQYPVNLVVADKRCLVVGGGEVAARKAAGLLESGARVHLIAETVGPGIWELQVGYPQMTVEERPYRSGEAAGYRLVIAATDQASVNHRVFADAEAAGVWVNVADDPTACTFTLPSVLRQGSVLVTVSTNGRSPALASWLRSRLAEVVGPEYQVLADLLSAERQSIQARGMSTEGVDWQSAISSAMLDLLRAGQVDEARERLRACLSSS